MALKLRSKSYIKYIGVESEDLLGGRFPLVREVLCYFFYQHRSLKKSVRESARIAVRKASNSFWEKTCIPLKQEIKSIAKLEKLHAQWKRLLKNKSRNIQNQVRKFTSNLDLVFDLSVEDAIPRMRTITKRTKNASVKRAIEEDLRFLEDQRSTRKAVIGGQDKNLRKVQKKTEKKKERMLQALMETQSRALVAERGK